MLVTNLLVFRIFNCKVTKRGVYDLLNTNNFRKKKNMSYLRINCKNSANRSKKRIFSLKKIMKIYKICAINCCSYNIVFGECFFSQNMKNIFCIFRESFLWKNLLMNRFGVLTSDQGRRGGLACEGALQARVSTPKIFFVHPL